MPAQAGTQFQISRRIECRWFPACAGMTVSVIRRRRFGCDARRRGIFEFRFERVVPLFEWLPGRRCLGMEAVYRGRPDDE